MLLVDPVGPFLQRTRPASMALPSSSSSARIASETAGVRRRVLSRG